MFRFSDQILPSRFCDLAHMVGFLPGLRHVQDYLNEALNQRKFSTFMQNVYCSFAKAMVVSYCLYCAVYDFRMFAL